MGACPGGAGRSQDPAHVSGGQGLPFQRGEPGEKSWVVRGRASPRSGGLSGGSGVSPRSPPPPQCLPGISGVYTLGLKPGSCYKVSWGAEERRPPPALPVGRPLNSSASCFCL